MVLVSSTLVEFMVNAVPAVMLPIYVAPCVPPAVFVVKRISLFAATCELATVTAPEESTA